MVSVRRVLLWGMVLFIALLTVISCGGSSSDTTSLQPITIVSLDPSDAEGDGDSQHPDISADGRYVAFNSLATNLVTGDTNNLSDIFVRDMSTGITARVNVSAMGTEATNGSSYPALSSNGRYVAFESYAGNLVAGDTNNRNDIFVYDRNTAIPSRVSVSSAGTQSDYSNYRPFISSDGRYVAFESYAGNLVPNDTTGNNITDIIVRDTVALTTTCASVSTAGTMGNTGSHEPFITDDGLYVAFWSNADNLVAGDSNGGPDIFLRDTATPLSSRLSVSPSGTEGDDNSYRASMTSDGRYVAFDSYAGNLVAGDSGSHSDIFVRETTTNITSIVSVSSAGTQGNLSSNYADISDDGRYVAFISLATNLVPGDTNGLEDIFVHDRTAGTTSRVSLSASGVEHDGHVYDPAISADGRYVVFESDATNLIDGVTLSGVRHIFRAPVQ